MSADLRPQASKLTWTLRTYGWLLAACTLACAALPLFITPSTPMYQASSLVVARDLAVNERVLPRLAEAVFAAGAVEEALAAEATAEGEADDLIPARVSVVAPEDSIVVTVQARDPDPVVAARLADLAAAALVGELNRNGAGVGEFSVGAEAVVSTEPLDGIPQLAWTAVGAVAGVTLGFGMIALIAGARRPVVTASDVQQAAGVPLLGTVRLPPISRDEYPGPLGISGLVTVTRRLASVPSGRLLLVSAPSCDAVRQRLFVMVSVALAGLRPVRTHAPREVNEAIRQHRFGEEIARTSSRDSETADGLLLVDGGYPLVTLDPATIGAPVVAVARLGEPRRSLRALSADYRDAGLLGVVLVDVPSRLERAVTHRSWESSGQAPTAIGPAGDRSEPERT
ncbi:YveK family protein [Geodermatophilus marinus]|uniref:hypothetical protein n=1 Tax=Geodermatophilus sp. LHW52908 TaxID=2303986 RepID=UPI000E3ED8DE|nr:hypothetical protein [Geodermatophilus sp. LHW52908]RFU21280.1 hypothetical protein D0Z06_10860 [Geodermatophilus sp. LHW52908]